MTFITWNILNREIITIQQSQNQVISEDPRFSIAEVGSEIFGEVFKDSRIMYRRGIVRPGGSNLEKNGIEISARPTTTPQ